MVLCCCSWFSVGALLLVRLAGWCCCSSCLLDGACSVAAFASACLVVICCCSWCLLDRACLVVLCCCWCLPDGAQFVLLICLVVFCCSSSSLARGWLKVCCLGPRRFVCLFVCLSAWLFSLICSTSPPGGNQVDGLPLAASYGQRCD